MLTLSCKLMMERHEPVGMSTYRPMALVPQGDFSRHAAVSSREFSQQLRNAKGGTRAHGEGNTFCSSEWGFLSQSINLCHFQQIDDCFNIHPCQTMGRTAHISIAIYLQEVLKTINVGKHYTVYKSLPAGSVNHSKLWKNNFDRKSLDLMCQHFFYKSVCKKRWQNNMIHRFNWVTQG